MIPLRLSHPPAPGAGDLVVSGAFALRPGRVHEICGPARRGLAVRVAGRLGGPVLWIRPAWQAERLNPDGICDLVWQAKKTLPHEPCLSVVEDIDFLNSESHQSMH